MKLWFFVLPVIVVSVFSGCTSLVFRPDGNVYATPADFNLRYEPVTFASHDGTQLSGWWIEPECKRRGTVVVVHGNAENMSSHFAGFVWLIQAGYEVFIFDYRGYGSSEGDPEFDGALHDVESAIGYVLNRRSGSLSVIGQSLGGALLIDALARMQTSRIRLAVIDSAFASLPEAGSDVLSRSALTWLFQWSAYLLLDGSYDPIDRVGKLTVPKLFIAGTDDSIVSPNHSWRLSDAASRPREFWLVENTGHTGAFSRRVIRQKLLSAMADPVFAEDYSPMLIFDTIAPSDERSTKGTD